MLANKLALFSYGEFSVMSKKVAAALLLSTGTACTHTHIGGGNASRTPAPILKIKKCVYVMIWMSPWMTSLVLKQVILSASP